MSDATQVRAGVMEFLRKELVGPDPRPEHVEVNGGEEILRPQDPPRLRYAAGVLFPGGARMDQAENATEEEAAAAATGPPEGDEPEDDAGDGPGLESDSGTEQEVNRANEYLPSAMGLSALVHLPRALKIGVNAARYERKVQVGLGKQDKEGNWQPHHWRRPVVLPPIEIDTSTLLARARATTEVPLDTGTSDAKLTLHVYSRPYADAEDTKRDRIVTFTLINRTEMSGDSPKDNECFFQCGFSVEDADGTACFLEYPEREALDDDEEADSLRLLYRHRKTFAVGHGCSATWNDEEADTGSRIATDTLPAYEIKPVLPRDIFGLDLSMRALARSDNPDALAICDRLATAYLAWIDVQARALEASTFSAKHRETAQAHLEECRECHARILDGITLLRADAEVRTAFAWMNEAMLLQQLHYDLAANHRRVWKKRDGLLALERPYSRPDTSQPPPGKGRWRPFQLAFILMNLRAIADPHDSRRRVVDLIWFPTGGGKTEAYLGLTAFTVFRRRLADSAAAGTTVLMRYTLRLLTTQQFQRAASLICACERLRRENESRLGIAPVSIGLWVGQAVTPNKNADAVAALNSLLRNGKPNPFVVLSCPWCGAEMGPVESGNTYQVKGYRKEAGRVVFRCEDPDCDFSDSRGLPLVVVDESIYRERPTLVIGTVDKFATLPWSPDARALFGLNGAGPVSPPELIIQDELHLISGALGSMVGMYEGTVEALCSREHDGATIGPKIVASTATIRRASDQIHDLYARPAFLFPPQGLTAGDSFFAHEVSHDESGNPVPGRLYVGVFGSALSSHVTAQVRVMAALLQAAKSVPASSEAVDPYWTLMAYFNSLRELGHAATLIRADIREHMNAMWDRLG